MPRNASSSVSVSRRGHSRLGSDPLGTVVWVRGEHDTATRMQLAVTIARAARLDGADIVVDLSGVTFMDASTIGALVGARHDLGALSRSLSVREPSPRARRVLDLCGLERLIDEHPAPDEPPVQTALGSWVDVPAQDRAPEAAPPPVAREADSQEPALAPARRLEPARSIQDRRAPS